MYAVTFSGFTTRDSRKKNKLNNAAEMKEKMLAGGFQGKLQMVFSLLRGTPQSQRERNTTEVPCEPEMEKRDFSLPFLRNANNLSTGELPHLKYSPFNWMLHSN